MTQSSTQTLPHALLISPEQIGWGRPGPFYHVNDVSVYQVGRGLPSKECIWHTCFFVLNQERHLFRFAIVQSWGRNYKKRYRGPLPPSVYLGRSDVIHVINWTRPSFIYAYCNNWMVGRPGKLGMRLKKLCTVCCKTQGMKFRWK